jgi:hypothetical protein
VKNKTLFPILHAKAQRRKGRKEKERVYVVGIIVISRYAYKQQPYASSFFISSLFFLLSSLPLRSLRLCAFARKKGRKGRR